MSITNLSSGGIIANYRCPAACGHCLYGSSPNAEAGYIDEPIVLCVHLGLNTAKLDDEEWKVLMKVLEGSPKLKQGGATSQKQRNANYGRRKSRG